MTPDPNIHWRPNRESAYLAVQLVMQGNGAAQVAQELFAAHGPKQLGRVASLLTFAREKGLFSLNPPRNDDLQIQLTERFRKEVTFLVVNNDYAAYVDAPRVDEDMHANAVCHQAAILIAQRIQELLLTNRASRRPIVIANAGGRAASRVVRFLASQKLMPDECDPRRLLFISLNSASMPSDYGRSANVLAVRMAEIYGGRHIALSPIWPDEVKKDYDLAVRNIDLLVCGAGSGNGILFTWLKDHAGIKLPAGAIGDICLIPISAEGDEVPLERQAPRRIRENLDPHPNYNDLKILAARDGVIFIPTGNQHDDGRPNPKAEPRHVHSKLAVTLAILNHSLTRTCVLGSTLARDILVATDPAPAPTAPPARPAG